MIVLIYLYYYGTGIKTISDFCGRLVVGRCLDCSFWCVCVCVFALYVTCSVCLRMLAREIIAV